MNHGEILSDLCDDLLWTPNDACDETLRNISDFCNKLLWTSNNACDENFNGFCDELLKRTVTSQFLINYCGWRISDRILKFCIIRGFDNEMYVMVG